MCVAMDEMIRRIGRGKGAAGNRVGERKELGGKGLGGLCDPRHVSYEHRTARHAVKPRQPLD